MNVLECRQQLLRDPLKPTEGEIRRFTTFSAQPGKVVKVFLQKLCHNDEMLLVVKVINQPQTVLLINRWSTSVDQPQKLDFVKRLIKQLLTVLDYLHAHHSSIAQVKTLHRTRRCGGAKVPKDPVARCNDTVYSQWELPPLLETGMIS
eukprot:CAMPEP_0172767492 /NCGR_PEP_ID=MMETSP1074-20121228/183004_1 /TAXON_ID=2916 /ORGANISM="Ceratium fusus, Strain PA161109" /LENGTH=147 /DNA_ID=CAMNT_0013602751 /DNA_START=576 /DNA_END=1016 /DNA_ORIENTATION=-